MRKIRSFAVKTIVQHMIGHELHFVVDRHSQRLLVVEGGLTCVTDGEDGALVSDGVVRQYADVCSFLPDAVIKSPHDHIYLCEFFPEARITLKAFTNVVNAVELPDGELGGEAGPDAAAAQRPPLPPQNGLVRRTSSMLYASGRATSSAANGSVSLYDASDVNYEASADAATRSGSALYGVDSDEHSSQRPASRNVIKLKARNKQPAAPEAPSGSQLLLHDDAQQRAAGPKAPRKGRVHMAMPSNLGSAVRLAKARCGGKHRRLFDPNEQGGLIDGEPVIYRTRGGEVLLRGKVVIPSVAAPTERKLAAGIFCYHCNQAITCSQFEAHAGMGQRRAPYDNIWTERAVPMSLKQMAAQLPDRPGDEEQRVSAATAKAAAKAARKAKRDASGGADAAPSVPHEVATHPPPQRTLAQVIEHFNSTGVEIAPGSSGTCMLCFKEDFTVDDFDAGTMILCDQCEREYHVGCMRDAGMCDLQALPPGKWFCSAACLNIFNVLEARHRAGQFAPAHAPEHTLQIVRASEPCHPRGTKGMLKAVLDILHEGFDPIADEATGDDLIDMMVRGTIGETWDMSNFYAVLLRHQGTPVVAAVMRVMGTIMLELPLIATRATAQRQGHARVLMGALCALLHPCGVDQILLPAHDNALNTWINGFGFSYASTDDVYAARTHMRMIFFPHTTVLKCPITPGPPPAPRRPPPLPAPPADQPAKRRRLTEAGAPGADGPAEDARDAPSWTAGGALPDNSDQGGNGGRGGGARSPWPGMLSDSQSSLQELMAGAPLPAQGPQADLLLAPTANPMFLSGSGLAAMVSLSSSSHIADQG